MKKFFTLLNLIFIFLIIHFLVSGLYGYYTREIEIETYTETRESPSSIIEKKKFQHQSYYKSSVRRNLFDTEEKHIQKKTQPIKSNTIPEQKIKLTELKLELKGTITGTGSDPFAVIKKKGDKKEMLYAEGDTVDRARIKEILRERVILSVDGRQETLLMKKVKGSKKPGTNGYTNVTDAFPGGDKESRIEDVTLAWNDVEILTGDLQALRKQVRVRPHFYKGKMDGFRVTGLKKGSVFYQKLGLRNGDVISAVNDEEIKSVNDVTRFYDGFRQLDGNVVMNVAIKRNGLPETIRYSIE